MIRESPILAGVLMVTDPAVILGGVSLLSLLVFFDEYAANPALGRFVLGIGLNRSRPDNA